MADPPGDELKQRRGSRVHPENVDEGVKVNQWKQTKFKMWTLFENPQSSNGAFILSVVLLVLILISCVAFCLQTIPVFYAGEQKWWDFIELICIVCFSIEYVARLVASPDRVSFCAAPLNVIDLVAIAPFYIEKVARTISQTGDVSGLAVFRIIRLARVFRLFKLGRYSDGLKTFANTMARSTRPLAMLMFFMIIAIILFSSAIYYCERGSWDEAQREWWRDQEEPTGQFEMITLCNVKPGTIMAISGTAAIAVDANFAVPTDGSPQSGWVPKIVSDFVTFPTGYIVEGSGIAVRSRSGTFTAAYADTRANGVGKGPSAADGARVTPEKVVTAMTDAAVIASSFTTVWQTATCFADPVGTDEAEMACTGNTYSDGMGVTEAADVAGASIPRSTFPALGEDAIQDDLRVTAARAIYASLPASQNAVGTVYTVEMTVELECREVGCLFCGDPSPFNSIPASFYWAAVTMTTVGYGDVFPTTTAGQFVASLTMMVGILILALPITVIGTYFAAEYEEFLRRQVTTNRAMILSIYLILLSTGLTLLWLLCLRRKSTLTTASG